MNVLLRIGRVIVLKSLLIQTIIQSYDVRSYYVTNTDPKVVSIQFTQNNRDRHHSRDGGRVFKHNQGKTCLYLIGQGCMS